MTCGIIFFSGTGNSFYVAKKLNQMIVGSSLIPIVGMMNSCDSRIEFDRVVLVFPMHALTMPIIVRKMIRICKFDKVQQIHIVVTRLGIVGDMYNEFNKIFKRKNKIVDSLTYINMYNNDCRDRDYKTPTDEQLQIIKKSTDEKIEYIYKLVRNEFTLSSLKDDDYLVPLPYGKVGNFLLKNIVIRLHRLSEYIGGVNYFYSDSNCNGCAVCEKVCLSEKIQIYDKRPSWKKDVLCYMCFACVNFCPKRAVQIKSIPGVKSFTNSCGRYNHPYITINEMEKQKHRTTCST